MKKIILILSLTMGFCTVAEAQMYVSPGSYVFVNDQYVYVTQEVELNGATSNFYLRNSSQLLQGVVGLGVNKGLGSLSVYQEGTVNNYQYNYWCSPVGIPSAAVLGANTNFGITRLFRPSVANKITSTPATIITSFDGTTTNASLSISNKWIWKYIASNIYGPGTGGWQYVGSASTVEPGLGFTMKGTSGTDNLVSDSSDGVQNKPNANNGQRYDFRGLPNDGNMTAAVSNAIMVGAYLNLTLVGNPYPSAINLNAYLLENSGFSVNMTTGVITPSGVAQIDNTAYFWEHSKSANTHLVAGYVGGYGTYVPSPVSIFTPGTYVAAPMSTYSADGETSTAGPSSGNSFQRQFTPVGQGFMVHGAIPAGTVTMRNKYRVFRREGAGNNSVFERAASNNNQGAELNNSSSNDNWDEIPNVAGSDYTLFSRKPGPHFKIHTSINDLVAYENALVFADNTSDDFDAFDGECAYPNVDKVAYLTTANGTDKLVISAMPFDIEKEIPMVFKSDASVTFKVKVSDLTYFDLAENIYLHDKVTNIYHDIKNGEFQLMLPAGEYNGRFDITFINHNIVLSEENDVIINSFQVFQNNNNSMLTVVNTLNKDVTSLKLYDVSGKLIVDKKNLGKANQYEISTSGLSDGIYIVKLTTQDNLSIDKKVSIFKK